MDKAQPAPRDGINKLKSGSDDPKKKTDRAKKSAEVADSWEDDIAASSSSDIDQPEWTDPSDAEPLTEQNSRPFSSADQEPQAQSTDFQSQYIYGPLPPAGRDRSEISKRPEKSTAAVRRMVAGSLGLKIRATEETKQFEKAQAAAERKRREDERRRIEEEREAQRSIWED